MIWRQFIIIMQDKKISQAFNKSLSKSSTHFCTFQGKNNYLRVHIDGITTYSYLEAFQSNKTIKFDLVTLKMSLNQDPEVYKNQVIFDPPTNFSYMQNESFMITFENNPKYPKQVLVSIHYQLKNGKKTSRLSRLYSFEFDLNILKSKESLYFIQFSLHKDLLRALWHPFYQGYVVILTKQQLQLVQIFPESENRINRVSLKQLNLGQQIVDFRFWPQVEGIRKYLIIAVGKSGKLHLLICPLQLQGQQNNLLDRQRQILKCKPEATFSYFDSLDFNLEWDCKGIQIACPSKTDYLLLFRRLSGRQDGRQINSIVVSALFQMATQIQERIILIINGQSNGPEFYLPQICLSSHKLYFWAGDQLYLLDLSAHIICLKKLQEQKKNQRIPESIQSRLLLSVPNKTFKFLSVQYGSLKLLRKAQTSHQYKFSTIAFDIINLQLEQKKASEKLEAVFRDVDINIKDLTATKIQYQIKSEIQLNQLKQNGDEKQVQTVKQNNNKYLKENAKKLRQQKQELDKLFEEAKYLAQQFQHKKSGWAELEKVLNLIDSNTKTIESLTGSNTKEDESGDKIFGLVEMHKYIKRKSINISQYQRQSFVDKFNDQHHKLIEVRRTIEDIQESLKFFDQK